MPNTVSGIIEQYNKANEKLNFYKERKQEAENLLKDMLGENETGTWENNIVTWKNITRDGFDSKTLKAEHPKLYEKYASRISYRRFSVKAV